MDVRCAILLFLLAASCEAVVAQNDTVINDSTTTGQAHGNLLVLIDGQIISGDVTPRPDGYDVQVPAGRMFINSDRVRFAASSLPDAYNRMRDTIPEFTPGNHMELARWCLSNKLHSQALREVLDTLYLDPNRNDAKRMLRMLEQTRQSTTVPRAGTGLTEYPSQTEMPRPTIETRSLAGLNRSVVHSFVGDVQRLLTNKCATSGCHGTGTRSQFEFVSTRQASTPAIAERNLAAVLKQIDFSNPSASPLLVTGEQAHGNMTYSAFQGRAGALQIKTLKDWVQQAAHDIAPDAGAATVELRATETEIPPSNILQVSAIDESMDKVKILRTPEGMSGNPHARQLTTDDTDGGFLQEAKYANRHDAFSPDEFNRRFHGRSANSSTEMSAAALEQTSKSTNKNTDAQFP